MLFRYKDQNKINFLEKKADVKSEDIQKTDVSEKDADCIQSQRAKKLSFEINPEDFSQSSKSVTAYRSGVVKDFGGPVKQVGVEGQFRIFSQAESDEKNSLQEEHEACVKERLELNEFRKSERATRMQNLADAIKSAETLDKSSVGRIGEYSGSSYRVPTGSFSIFDKEFDLNKKIPEKTAGEKASEDKLAEMNKVDDWRVGAGKVTHSKDLLKKILNNKDN